MLKKVLVLLLLCLTAVLFLPHETKAVEGPNVYLTDDFFPPNNDYTDGNLHVTYNGSRKFFHSVPVLNKYETWTVAIADSYSPTGPYPTGYIDPVDFIAKAYITIYDDSPQNIFDDSRNTNIDLVKNVDTWELNQEDLSSYAFKYFVIIVEVKSSFINDTLLEYGFFKDSHYKQVYANSEASVVVPETTGNPFESIDDFGEVVNWSYENNDFSAGIYYGSYYNLFVEDVIFPNDDFLLNVEKVYYYTLDEEQYLIFYYADIENEAIETSLVTKFAFWNITQNEVYYQQSLRVLTYLEKDDDRNIYAYAYIPDVPVDDILLATVKFDYRFYEPKFLYDWIAGSKPTEWQTRMLSLEKDILTDPTMSQWTYDVLSYSLPALFMNTALAVIFPASAPVTVPLAYTSLLATFTGLAGGAIDMVLMDTSQITRINYPSNDLRYRINEHLQDLNGGPIEFGTTPIYRFFLGGYAKPGTSDVEINPDSYQYLELVYTSQGEVYTFTEEYIEDETVIDDTWIDNLPDDEGLIDTIVDGANGIYLSLIVPLVTIMFVYMGVKGNVFKDMKKLIIIIPLFVLVLYLLGVF